MNDRKKIISEIVLNIIEGREQVKRKPSRFEELVGGVAEVMQRKDPASEEIMSLEIYPVLPNCDLDLIREVFWDLVVEKVITIGKDSMNPIFPWFKLHSEHEPKES